jgi:hypothetical protein
VFKHKVASKPRTSIIAPSNGKEWKTKMAMATDEENIKLLEKLKIKLKLVNCAKIILGNSVFICVIAEIWDLRRNPTTII